MTDALNADAAPQDGHDGHFAPAGPLGFLELDWHEVQATAAATAHGDPIGWVLVASSASRIADEFALRIGERDAGEIKRIELDGAHGLLPDLLSASKAQAGNNVVLFLEQAEGAPSHAGDGRWRWAAQLIDIAKAVATGDGAKLWVVTMSAIAFPQGRAIHPELQFAWGAARCFAAEHPDAFGGIVDVDGNDSAALADLLTKGGDEDELVLREGRIFVPRLVAAVHSKQSLRLDQDALYMISGGLSGLAFELAQWLPKRGAGHLLLVGHSCLDDERQRRLDHLQPLYKSVEYRQADVGDAGAVEALQRDLEERWPGALGGIFHLASSWQRNGKSAVLPLLSLQREDVEEVIHAKAEGGLQLDALGERLGAGFVLYFSSAAATIGSPGQANYAGANAVLHGLAERAADRGRRACSIAWGPIGGAGFGALTTGSHVHQLWEKMGIARLSLEAMFEALETALTSGMSSASMIELTSQAQAGLPWLRRRPIYSELVPHGGADAAPEPTRSAHSRISREQIEDHLLATIPRILSIPAEMLDRDALLSDIGVDSLVALELMFTLERDMKIVLPYTETIMDLNISIRDISAKIESMMSAEVASF